MDGSIQHSTPRECQRRIFVDSLYRELDKLAATADRRNHALSAKADKLLFEEGLSPDSCVDLLVMEGYDSSLARQCVSSVSTTRPTNGNTETQSQKYNYSFVDHRGRIFTGRELGDIVEAETEEDAKIQIAEILSGFEPPVRLLGLEPLA